MNERPLYPTTIRLPEDAQTWIAWANEHIADQDDEIRALRFERDQLAEKVSELLTSKRIEVHHHHHYTTRKGYDLALPGQRRPPPTPGEPLI